MSSRYLLGIALAVATAAAACTSTATNTLDNGEDGTEGDGNGTGSKGGKGGKTTPGQTGETDPGTNPGTEDPGTPSGPVATNSPAGKQFYKAEVHPFMATKCGACHGSTGPGPNWLTSADAEKSYAQLFAQGYVVPQSRITLKPAHGGVTNNVLAQPDIQKYEQWVGMELKDGGNKAPPNVLANLGACFDRGKFNAMEMGNWRTRRRNNENPDNCTGCDNAPCSTCHSSDPATNFINAVGNPILPNDYTFEQTKATNPGYITKFFGVSPDGKPVASDGLKKKAEATAKDRPYTHPMYRFNEEQQGAIDAFVNDAITKFNAGTCGQPQQP